MLPQPKPEEVVEQDRFTLLRTEWSKSAGNPILGLASDSTIALSRNIVQVALKQCHQNINLASSNLFTNALKPEDGCPPILGLALDEGVEELSGVKREHALKLYEDLGKSDLEFMRIIRDQLIAIAFERVEGDEEKTPASPSFSRQASNPLATNISPAKCLICLETFGEQGAVLLRACDHSFCVDCLKNYVSASEATGQIVLTCPLNECKKAISQRELIAIVGLEKFEKLDRRALERIIAHDNTFHMCATPDCAYLVCWEGGSDGLPWMLCPKCGHERCLKCGKEPYHKGKTCQEVLQAEEDLLNQELFKRLNYRPCPQCKIPIEKSDGCNKMLCYCGCKFCSECYALMPECAHVVRGHGYLHPKTKGFIYQNQATPDLKYNP